CKLLDPVVVFLQSKVENLRLLIASGWGPQVTLTKPTGISMDATGRCGLASNPSATTHTHSWPARRVQYHNLLGMLMVDKFLGRQSVTISCDTSCIPRASAFNEESSANGNLGYNVACA